jgi:DNA/RNA endonuclease YhcR with UshA esterase domain
LDELFKDRNICVKGTLEEFKGKPQIVVEDPEDIIIQ